MRPRRIAVAALFVTCVLRPAYSQQPQPPVVVASKPFGESYLLAEMFAQLLESRGFPVERKPGLGATEIAFARTGERNVTEKRPGE